MNIEKTCRCCLANVEPLASIYDGDLNNSNYSLAYMIKEITSVKPELDDKLPDKVCSSCISDIRRFYNFKIKCEKSNRTLHQLLCCKAQVHLESSLYSSKTILNNQFAEKVGLVQAEKHKQINQDENKVQEYLKSAFKSSRTTAKKRLKEEFLATLEDIAPRKDETKNNKTKPESFASNLSSSYTYSTENSVQLTPLEIIVKEEFNDTDTFPVCSSAPEEIPVPEIMLKQEYDSDIYPIYSENIISETPWNNIDTISLNLKAINNSNHNLKHVNSGDNCDDFAHHCVICNKGLLNNYELADHLESHEKPYSCIYCNIVFDDYTILSKHIFEHTSKQFVCELCLKRFYTLTNLKTHLRSHTREKPFKCSYCDKAFSQASSRTAHERSHTGEKPFKCNYCDKSFKQLATRNIHERTHTGETPYKCKYCDKSFKQEINCTIHERIHTGETPYKCSYCEKGFKQSNSLKYHIRQNHSSSVPKYSGTSSNLLNDKYLASERRFKCSYCDERFSNSTLQVIHERTHTGENSS